MFVEDLKDAIKEAMRTKDVVGRDVLRTALGEIQTAETRQGKALSDDEAHKVVRKLLQANEESLGVVTDPDAKKKLERESEVLGALLPRQLSVDEIVEALAEVRGQIEGAKADGPATGVAMKHLKSKGAAVDGKSVGEAVRRIRA